MWLFLFFLIASLGSRGLLVTANHAQWTANGIASDLAISLLLAGMGLFLLRFHRALAAALCLLFSILLLANMESIVALNKSIDLRDLSYALDPAFLVASTAQIRFPLFGLMLAAGLVAGCRIQQPASLPAIGLLSSFAVMALVLFGGEPRWQENHPLLTGIVRAAYSSQAGQTGHGSIPGLARDLSGSSLLDENRARNVILLILEGISEDYLEPQAIDSTEAESILMPRLAARYAQGLRPARMVTHSHQTIRGLYALLCGDYSKLSLSPTKASEYLQLPEVQRPSCLPEALVQRDFTTHFFQAAPLSYMGKDRFMPAIGFQQVLGEESFERRYTDQGWGPDDRAFLEQAAERIEGLSRASKSPFFVTLLTVGTHHPYTLPEELSGGDAKLEAIRYLDRSLSAFIDGLASAGVLEDSLLIVTSDESHRDNRGLWLALGPGIQTQTNRGLYGLLDTPISILDYLELTDAIPSLGGRSLFRQYNGERKLLFRGHALSVIESSGQRTDCDAPGRCRRDGELLPADESEAAYARLEDWRRRADASLQYSEQLDTLPLLQDTRLAVASGELNLAAAGRYLALPANREISMHLDTTYHGSGTARIKLGIIDQADDSLVLPPPELPGLLNGQRLQLVYRVSLDKPVSAAQPALLTPVDDGAGSLDVHRFSVEIGPDSEGQDPDIAFLERTDTALNIGHAGGRWQGIDYSNSVEAIKANARRFPVLEIDLSLSSDQRLVCLHDWELGFRALFGYHVDGALDYQSFVDLKPAHTPGFTPCNEESLLELLHQIPELRLVIDSWSDGEAILSRLRDLVPGYSRRVIPQAYTPAELKLARELGYEDVIWTLYRYPRKSDLEHVLEQAEELMPYAVTIPVELSSTDLPERLLNAGQRVYVHTVNDCDSALELYQRGLGIYSDTLQPQDCPEP